jgi:hypothetical protein
MRRQDGVLHAHGTQGQGTTLLLPACLPACPPTPSRLLLLTARPPACCCLPPLPRTLPHAQVAREGTKKTVFTNFQELCKAMNRQQEHVSQYLLAELGTSGNLDGQQRLIVKGRFLPKGFETVLRRYVYECVSVWVWVGGGGACSEPPASGSSRAAAAGAPRRMWHRGSGVQVAPATTHACTQAHARTHHHHLHCHPPCWMR